MTKPNCFYTVKLVKHQPTVVDAFDSLAEAQADVEDRVSKLKNPSKSPIKYRAGELGHYGENQRVFVSTPQQAVVDGRHSMLWAVDLEALHPERIKIDIQPDNPDLPRIQSDTFSYDLVKDVNHELDFNLDGLGDNKGLQQ